MIAPGASPLGYAAALALMILAAVGRSTQDETNSVLNQRISVSNQEETVNIGKQETNNYRHEENNYQPMQNTHVTVNVGKVKSMDRSKMRKHRPPTAEETALKSRMLEIYEQVKAEVGRDQNLGKSFLPLDHLGRILSALNPKYIATKRVWRVAFADSMDPAGKEVVAPERDLEEIYERELEAHASQPLELNGDQGHPPVILQLDQLANKFRKSIKWNERFVQKLVEIPDSELTGSQLAFKQLLQCLTYPPSCNTMAGSEPKRPVSNEPHQFLTSAMQQGPAEERFVSMTPSASNEFMSQQVEEYPPMQADMSDMLLEQFAVTPQRYGPPAQQEPKANPLGYRQVSEQLQYRAGPMQQAPIGRRRFPLRRRLPPSLHPAEDWTLRYPAQDEYPAQQSQEQGGLLAASFEYGPEARFWPQSRLTRRGPPHSQASKELPQTLNQRYAAHLETRKLG